MMPSLVDDGFSGLDSNDEQQVHVIESEHGILNYAWNPVHPSVYIATGNAGVDSWALNPSEEGTYESTRTSSSRSSLMNENTRLLPGPYGERLALLYHKPNSRESSVYIKRFADGGNLVASKECTYAPSSESPHDKSSSLSDPFVKIGTSKSPILDLKWANPSLGSASESHDSGLDLLVLNEEALLQVIHLSNGGRNRSVSNLFDGSQSFGPKRVASSFAFTPNNVNSSAANLYSSANELSQIDLKNHRYSFRGMKQSLGGASNRDFLERADSNATIAAAAAAVAEAGRDRVNTLNNPATSTANLLSHLEKRDLTPTTPNTLKRNSFGSKSFSLAASSSAAAAAAVNSTNNAAYAGNPHLVVVGPVRFYSLLEEDINALEYGINHGYLEGWRIGRIDQFSRRIVLELLIPNIDSYTITNTQQNSSFSSYYRSEDLNSFYHKKGSNSVRIMELVLLFPIKFINFWNPTFSIEDKTGLGVCSL